MCGDTTWGEEVLGEKNEGRRQSAFLVLASGPNC